MLEIHLPSKLTLYRLGNLHCFTSKVPLNSEQPWISTNCLSMACILLEQGKRLLEIAMRKCCSAFITHLWLRLEHRDEKAVCPPIPRRCRRGGRAAVCSQSPACAAFWNAHGIGSLYNLLLCRERYICIPWLCASCFSYGSLDHSFDSLFAFPGHWKRIDPLI